MKKAYFQIGLNPKVRDIPAFSHPSAPEAILNADGLGQ